MSGGLTATENNISCSNAKSVGKNIYPDLDNGYVENAKIRQKD